MSPFVAVGESPLESTLGIGEVDPDDTARGRAQEASLAPVTERVVFLGVDAVDWIAAGVFPDTAPDSLAEIWWYADRGAYCDPKSVWIRRLGRGWGRGAVIWCGLCYGLAAAVQFPLWVGRIGGLWRARQDPDGLRLHAANPVPLGELARSVRGSFVRLLWHLPIVAATGLLYVAAWTGSRFLNAVRFAAWTAVVLTSIAAIAAHH